MIIQIIGLTALCLGMFLLGYIIGRIIEKGEHNGY